EARWRRRPLGVDSGARKAPPALVGREPELEIVEALLERVGEGGSALRWSAASAVSADPVPPGTPSINRGTCPRASAVRSRARLQRTIRRSRCGGRQLCG